MLTVQNDWVQYESTPARRPAVRGGAMCAQRIPVVRAPRPVDRASAERSVRVAVRPAPRPADRAPRRVLRLTRRGRLVLVVLPAAAALSVACLALTGVPQAQAAQPVPSVQIAPSR